jgi:aminoglycoside/choline kinase family phosphotransferase
MSQTAEQTLARTLAQALAQALAGATPADADRVLRAAVGALLRWQLTVPTAGLTAETAAEQTLAQTLAQALAGATPADADRVLRAAVGALLRWQLTVPTAGLTAETAADLQARLTGFVRWCVQGEHAITWTVQESAAWQRCQASLVALALSQPAAALHGAWTAERLFADDGQWLPASRLAVGLGPVGADLADLLRDSAIAIDETQELDAAVRWWDAARHAGLPVDADFGAFWRAYEWLALQQQLVKLGELYRLKHQHGSAPDVGTVHRLLTGACRTALRYGPLKPLLRLLQPMSELKVDAGFTF